MFHAAKVSLAALFRAQDTGSLDKFSHDILKPHLDALGRRHRSIMKRRRIAAFGTSKYWPAGERRNCGDRGINPKSFHRKNAGAS